MIKTLVGFYAIIFGFANFATGIITSATAEEPVCNNRSNSGGAIREVGYTNESATGGQDDDLGVVREFYGAHGGNIPGEYLSLDNNNGIPHNVDDIINNHHNNMLVDNNSIMGSHSSQLENIEQKAIETNEQNSTAAELP